MTSLLSTALLVQTYQTCCDNHIDTQMQLEETLQFQIKRGSWACVPRKILLQMVAYYKTCFLS